MCRSDAGCPGASVPGAELQRAHRGQGDFASRPRGELRQVRNNFSFLFIFFYSEVHAIWPVLPPNHWGEGFGKYRSWVAGELMEQSRHSSGGDAGNPI